MRIVITASNAPCPASTGVQTIYAQLHKHVSADALSGICKQDVTLFWERKLSDRPMVTFELSDFSTQITPTDFKKICDFLSMKIIDLDVVKTDCQFFVLLK